MSCDLHVGDWVSYGRAPGEDVAYVGRVVAVTSYDYSIDWFFPNGAKHMRCFPSRDAFQRDVDAGKYHLASEDFL